MSTDRSLRARQLYRFYQAATGEEKSDIWNRLETADPGFKMLKDLGWDLQLVDGDEEKWLDGWNKKGQIKSWISNNLASWRRTRDRQEESKTPAGGSQDEETQAVAVGGQPKGEQPSHDSSIPQPKDRPSSPQPSAAAHPHRLVRSQSLGLQARPDQPRDMANNTSLLRNNVMRPIVIPASNGGRNEWPLRLRTKGTTTINKMPGEWDAGPEDVDHGAEGLSRGETVGDGDGPSTVGLSSGSSVMAGRDGAAIAEGSQKRVTHQERQKWLDWYRNVFLPEQRKKEKE
ncbi:uncharacterized protein LY79DRAFT_674589 [Colletotrichum navitas]|uniref:Uncharacterized protein n=1 Tax=Colletotrichum navitas TaxID=681940 RepID=A0AAD8PKX7_9PEZI|nr:uncharacterized protein LY79DRAFT_674589 [Colletotrichum navitas]KAK1569555.1 hypothetical protein LY79DRAFT_674589 [Colletotrichum navitas]